jgi:hypothetical protein
MIKPTRSAEQQVADEADRKALDPLAPRQTISDSQAEPEFQENHKTDRPAREAKRRRSERGWPAGRARQLGGDHAGHK